MALVHTRPTHIFINCPFDASYQPVFHAIVFAALDLGFVPRCALEVDDSSENRLDKIMRIIEECRFGVHDISAVALGAGTNLPRFNMPLELGLYLGCKRFGGEQQRKKRCLVLDSDPYRYRASMSDISGQDIHTHGGEPARAIVEVRNWLAGFSKRKHLPGGSELVDRYCRFEADAPRICKELKLAPAELTFGDRCHVIRFWLQADR
jgi:hypothetical protein